MDTPRHSMRRHPSYQKYLLLSSQQEVLRRRLSLQIPCSSPMTASSPELQSLASSPPSITTGPMSTYPVPTTPGIGHTHTVEDPCNEDEQKALYEINQQIKATLTELLNTDSVRSDEKYRAWIQERLMDAEHQIRKQRRRQSGADRDFAQSIAERFERGVFRITP